MTIHQDFIDEMKKLLPADEIQPFLNRLWQTNKKEYFCVHMKNRSTNIYWYN